jgi:kynureninase
LLFKALHAAAGLNPERTEIVVDSGNFPTDRYIAEAVARQRGLQLRTIDVDPWDAITEADLIPHLNARTAAVLLSHVNYRSAHINDLLGLNRLIHDVGGVAVWDLCHSAGALPIDLDQSGATLAVGCTYKFLNGGPGAPAFLYARADRQAELVQPIPGWMSANDIFGMLDQHHPAPGMRRFLSGTPSVLALAGVADGAALVTEAGIDAVREKSQMLTQFVIERFDQHLSSLGYDLATPRAAAVRGSHVTIRRHDAAQVCDRLVERGVIVDFRNPDGVRLGLSPLSTSFAEVDAALAVIRDLG